MPGSEGSDEGRDIVLWLQGQGLHRISELHPIYAPLQYPLLFVYGELGWSESLRLRDKEDPSIESNSQLSQTRYAAFCIQHRPNEAQTLLRAGHLFTCYIVDMWASADQNRLRYFCLNQSKIRAELYNGLEDVISHTDTGEYDLSQLGQRVVLPSSYIGGPHNMMQHYQDAMAVACHFHKVDIFLTMTCNPKWKEIIQELLEGQSTFDRPDLVARVFQMKKNALLEDIYKGEIFGTAVAYVYTIEFQKCGLPHMHCLIFLDQPHKLTTPETIDLCIRAYWPDPKTEPLLFETVKVCMVHGPCGTVNPTAPCMENGKCTKGFPKPFISTTTLNADGFPGYQRPDNGCKFQIGIHWVDNSLIVPYNAFISAKYDCHINVECAANLGSIGYIVKYMEKGPDKATLEMLKE